MVNQQSIAQQNSFAAYIRLAFNSLKFSLTAIFRPFSVREVCFIFNTHDGLGNRLFEIRLWKTIFSSPFNKKYLCAHQAGYKTNITTTFILLFLLGTVCCTRKDTVGQQDRTVMAQGVQQAEQLPGCQQDKAISMLEAKVRLLEARNASIELQAKITLAAGLLLVGGMVFCYLYIPYVRARQKAFQLELNRKEIFQELAEMEEAMKILRKVELDVQRHKLGLNKPIAEA